MFDIIDYALKNNVAIVIDPYSEVGLKITVGTGVFTAENSTTVDCGFHLETEPEKAQEYAARHKSKQMRDREDFFREV